MKDTLFSVEGKVAIVTGGLGQLGSQFANELLKRGAKVAVFGRTMRSHSIEQLYSKEDRDLNRVSFHTVDITDKQCIHSAVDAVVARWGIPHILVNNAGIDTQPSAPAAVSGPFENFPEDVFREVVDVNLTGTFLMIQAVGALMAEHGRGSIINIGSIYGMLSPIQDIYAYKKNKTGIPFIKPVAYSAAKSGLYNLTRYCATYWAKKGVRVNILSPSGVFRNTQDAEFQKNYCERMPIGRMARSEEYNGAIIFLASDASLYMTGANLVMDGGWTAW
ncbi:MAG: short-chain dehydrogenase [Spirochaetae bacterium HGW-Spirochaetae-4]|jgi:NAD(P)-dependent dehydrogenase (short-subunit alcohol dehydrogenase family)|nr:MAG: short-chain dehydrogenase [Spirochaetae bacterium HGW-Spirochaetae-4]